MLHTVIIWLETLQRAPSGTRVRLFSLGCLDSLERMELVDSLPVVWIEILFMRASKGQCMTKRSPSSPWPCSLHDLRILWTRDLRILWGAAMTTSSSRSGFASREYSISK